MAGLLGEIAGAEMSAVLRTCQSCGHRRVIGVQEKRFVVEWRGLDVIAR